MNLEGQLLHQQTYEVLRTLFSQFRRSCLMNTDGTLIHLNYESLGDLGTLPLSCEIAHRYLQLNDKDIVLTNDPFSGGTAPSAPTLILGVSSKPGKAEFLVATRLAVAPKIGPHKTIDDEGIRIPPSPLVANGKVNEALLEALKTHPGTTPLFIEVIENEIKRLFSLHQQIIKVLAQGRLDLSKNYLKNYLKSSADILRAKLEDLPYGEALVEDEYGAKDILKLRLELSEGSVHFDYSGTATGQRIFVTDSAAYGASVAGLLSRFHAEIPLNSGTLGLFHITAPKGSMVNASYPRPALLGQTDGLIAITSIVLEALSRIDKKHPIARSGVTHMMHELDFGNKLIYMNGQPLGVGAQHQRKGLAGVDFWRRYKNYPILPIETQEKIFPIKILSVGFRANSGGDGAFRGGDGSATTIKLLKPATLRWQFLKPARKPEGVHGGKSGLPGEMIVQKGNGERIVLDAEGTLALDAGDILITMGPGGGGYGLPEAKSAEVKN